MAEENGYSSIKSLSDFLLELLLLFEGPFEGSSPNIYSL